MCKQIAWYQFSYSWHIARVSIDRLSFYLQAKCPAWYEVGKRNKNNARAHESLR